MSLLTSIGIGNAEVKLILPEPTVVAGGVLEGTVEVQGGDDEQEIEGIYAALHTRYLTPEGHHEKTITEYQLTEGFTIHPDERKEFDVSLSVPTETPVTSGKTTVWVDIDVNIDWSADPTDENELTVEPNQSVEALLEALDHLSFERTAHEPVATVATPLAGHGDYAQEISLQIEGYDSPVFLTYTVEEDGTLLFGLHQDSDQAGQRAIGQYDVESPNPKVIADDIERLLATDHSADESH